MDWVLLNEEEVVFIHDEILNPGELQGFAGNKSLDSALSRVVHRVNFGLVSDVYDLAVVYAMVVATGHCFNDGNKRTAYAIIPATLKLNGHEAQYNEIELADMVRDLAQSKIDETQLANWLRIHAQQNCKEL